MSYQQTTTRTAAEPKRVVVSGTHEANCQKAAERLAKAVESFIPTADKPYLVLGMATGGTQEPFYDALVQLYDERKLDFSKVIFFNLDEYVGLPKAHPQSYDSYMRTHLYDRLNDPERQPHAWFLPDGNAANLDAECRRYEQAIQSYGGIDIQMLGIGENGHLAFMEPGTPFDARTQAVLLTDSTRQANKRFFGDAIEDVPTHALSMGLGTIMEAKEIILLANKQQKSKALENALMEKVTVDLPASILQRHARATVYMDYSAARNFPKRGDQLYAGR